MWLLYIVVSPTPYYLLSETFGIDCNLISFSKLAILGVPFLWSVCQFKQYLLSNVGRPTLVSYLDDFFLYSDVKVIAC